MMPLDTAYQLARASNDCEKYKCPFASKCKGDHTSCVMKEIAAIIRAQNADIELKTSQLVAANAFLNAAAEYIDQLEKVNKRYHDIVVAFQNGYRPKSKRYNPKRNVNKKKKKDLVEMDGDERYAYDPPSQREPKYPVTTL